MHDIRIERDGAMLAGSYSPAGETAIVALHGAAQGTRDHFLYRRLHAVLPSIGVGVVTFDRRGEGESTGTPSRGRFELQADDALAVVEEVGASRVGLWGFSQGAWIAPLAARSEHIDFLVLIASTGVTPAQQMMYATAEQLQRAGYDDAVVGEALTLRERFAESVRGDRHGEEAEVAAALQQATNRQWWPLAFLPSRLPSPEERRRWIEEMEFQPEPVFCGVRIPTLLFYGADDAWTPVQASIDAWRRARGSDVDIVVVADAGHDLTLSDGSLSADYERAMIEWLITRV
ncbi:MAG: alpha/beta fold hydrolase [Chloroflexota bacterium]|nr:alpha/beta fold hydrolase [Chloroflexota bacterium]